MYGSIELGYDDYSRTFVRALDIGRMMCEWQEHYPAMDEALQALERVLEEWMRLRALRRVIDVIDTPSMPVTAQHCRQVEPVC